MLRLSNSDTLMFAKSSEVIITSLPSPPGGTEGAFPSHHMDEEPEFWRTHTGEQQVVELCAGSRVVIPIELSVNNV